MRSEWPDNCGWVAGMFLLKQNHAESEIHLIEPADIRRLRALPFAHLAGAFVLVRVGEPNDHVVCGIRFVLEIADRGGSIVCGKGVRFGFNEIAADLDHL